MKILFILKNENFLAPIGLCSVSAMLRKAGYGTYLCEINSQEPLQCVSDLKPDIIAYSASTGEAKHYLKLNSIIKEKFPNIFTVMGGPHPTFYPDVVHEGGLDAICMGEGDYAIVDLIKTISAGRNVDGIPNIVSKNNKDKFIIRNLVEDLDSLPFPDFSLIYNNTPLGEYPLKSIITSRGCPFKCSYCFNAAWNEIYRGKGSVIRRHSVEYIIDEIKYVKSRWPLSFIKFYDDVFTCCENDWLEEFSKKYKKNINLPFFILTRADLINEEMVKLLKYTGCHTISMSIETGNSTIREKLLKRKMSNKEIIDKHRMCDKYGIYTFTNCIIGLPETSIENDIESIDLAIKAKVTWAEFPIFYPYPGTELGQLTIDKGLYQPDFSNMHTSYQYKTPLKCFTDKEAKVHTNLSILGSIAIVMPCFRSLIVRFLILMPHNFIFTFIYYLVKMYVFRKKIYVTKTNFWVSLKIFFRSLKQEWFRHENAKG